jgi:hypothetical protein
LGCSKRIKDPVQAVKRAIRRAKIRVPQRSVMGFTMKKNGSDKKHPFCISLLENSLTGCAGCKSFHFPTAGKEINEDLILLAIFNQLKFNLPSSNKYPTRIQNHFCHKLVRTYNRISHRQWPALQHQAQRKMEKFG